MNKPALMAALAAAAILALALVAFHPGRGGTLYIWVADAYVGEAKYLASSFQRQYGVPYVLKSGGSFALAREIALGEPASVFIPVDASAAGPRFLGDASPGWVVAFASDQMVLAYTESSVSANAYAREALADARDGNWSGFFYLLTSGEVKVGISNPLEDPAGYRAWLVLKLAGYEYANGDADYFYDRLYNSAAVVTAPSAAALVAPLQAGDLNFLFIYKSAAVAKNLSYISLPPQVNLGEVNYSSLYSSVSVTFGNVTFRGSPIFLYLTVPRGAVDRGEAEEFVSYALRESGNLSAYGLVPLRPALLFNSTQVPQWIQALIKEGYLEEAGGLG